MLFRSEAQLNRRVASREEALALVREQFPSPSGLPALDGGVKEDQPHDDADHAKHG